MPWHRACPEGLEIRHCDAAAKGNGLFTTRALEEGQQLFEEDPVCGMALLMFDQTNVTCHCQHCMKYVEGGEASLVLCALGCGAWYCSEACREDAFVAHHSVLCSSSNPRWADYEQQARECCNEYYVLAARALATLTSEFSVEEDLWAQSPWSGYASPCWWETMKRPIYEDSDSESSGPAFDSEDEESLDRFFQSTVRSQTSEMGDVLLSVLEGKTCALAEALLRSGPEALGRLMGLLRVNAMALHAQVASGDGDAEDVAKGMAIYSVTSAMNHDPAANCFVSSDPAYPQRCLVRTLRPIEPEEELCIDYLQGSPYSMEQRNQVLLQQYGIVA